MANVPMYPKLVTKPLDVLMNRIAEQRARAEKQAAEALERRRKQEDAEKQAEEEVRA
jgi:hypothetical protein